MLNINRLLFVLSFLIISGFIYGQSLDSLEKLAVEVSPELKMLQAKSEAAEDRISQNSNLPGSLL